MDKKDIVRYMATIVANLNTKGKFTNTYYRILGGLEGMLICIGKIPLEGKLPYIEVPHTHKPFFGKKTETTRIESYNEMIIRLVNEAIKENL
jgi:hypothetical protein